jgi:hypothetical protein
VGLPTAAGYTDQQQATMEGLRLSYQLGEAHERYMQGGDATTFNAIIDQWNAWVQTNFGQDPTLLMAKVAAPVDLGKTASTAFQSTSVKPGTSSSQTKGDIF